MHNIYKNKYTLVTIRYECTNTMGQRHQFYIIYNKHVICFHHQWLYGVSALEALVMFLCLYNQANNFMYYFREIDTNIANLSNYFNKIMARIEQTYDYHGNTLNSSFLLEEDDVAPEDRDNNDGITIVDITDIKNPLIGFHYLDKKGVLSPFGYLNKYYTPETISPNKGRILGKSGKFSLTTLSEYTMISNERVYEIFPTLR